VDVERYCHSDLRVCGFGWDGGGCDTEGMSTQGLVRWGQL